MAAINVDNGNLAHLATRQLADYDAHHPGMLFRDGIHSLTTSDAYAVQQLVAKLRVRRGEPVAGYKTGCVSDVVQRQLGIDRPVFGYLFRSELYPSGATLDSACFDHLAIEGEFAVRLARDISAREYLRNMPVDAIDSVLPIIELHNNVFRARTRTAQELICNNALHAGVVLPDGDGAQNTGDVLSVFLNGVEVGVQSPDALPGGIWQSLFNVAQHVIATEGCLRKGTLILTGSALPLYPVKPGDHIIVRSQRCGHAEAFVEHAPKSFGDGVQKTPAVPTLPE